MIGHWHLNTHMDSFLAPLVLGSLTSFSYVLGELTADTRIPLGPAVAVFASIAAMVWWLGQKLQAHEDALKTIGEKIDRVERDLCSRPCQINGTECGAKKP